MEQAINHIKKKSGGFLQQIVQGDETWVHHYDPENKDSICITTTKDYQYQRKSKPKPPVEKSCSSVFWNSEGVVLTDFLDKGDTVNSECSIITLKYLFNKTL